MNSTQESDSVDFPKSQYSTEKNSSVLAFSAKTDMDFGTTITCLATDAVGQTSQPCTFQIVRKGANNDTSTLLKDLLHCNVIWKNAKKIWSSNSGNKYLKKGNLPFRKVFDIETFSHHLVSFMKCCVGPACLHFSDFYHSESLPLVTIEPAKFLLTHNLKRTTTPYLCVMLV